MSIVSLDEQTSSHIQCNGNLNVSQTDENVKTMPEKFAPPNGIHVSEKEPRMRDMNNEVITMINNVKDAKTLSQEKEETLSNTAQEEKILREKVETSTAKLIDEFSTALALSLVHSSSKETEDRASSSRYVTDTSNDSETKANKTDESSENSSENEYPESKTAVNSDYVIAIKCGIKYFRYESERQMSAIMQLITKDLSEPYSIYTYRYFIHNWPHLCFLAMHEASYVGAIVCKLDLHKKVSRRGYIAMLAVDQSVRRRKIGTNLVKMAIETMNNEGCDEVVLETEVTNKPALNLYENLGFVRDKRLFRYYLNGVDALRLKLWLR